jgi:calcium-binding protein CML
MSSEERLIASFRAFDLNNDGVITQDEFVTVLMRPNKRSQPLTLEEAQALFREVDANGDGHVSIEEFGRKWFAEEQRVATAPRAKKTYIQGGVHREYVIEDDAVLAVQEALEAQVFPLYCDLKSAFDDIDTNRNGLLCTPEFAAALERFGFDLTDDQIALLASKYDADGNGQIDYEEFERALGRPVPRRGVVWADEVEVMGGAPAEVRRAHGVAAADGVRSAEGGRPGGGRAPPAPPAPPPAPPPSGGAPPAAAQLDSASLAQVAGIEASLRTRLEDKYRTMREAFRAVDADSSHDIDAAEFGAILKRVHVQVASHAPPLPSDLRVHVRLPPTHFELLAHSARLASPSDLT